MSASGQYQIACTYGTYGIYYSSNYGVSWTASNAPTSPQWYEVCMSTSGQYASACSASTSTITYYSSNYGQTWTASATIASTSYQGIACSASGQYQVCGGVSGNIYYSTTYGQTWINSNVSSAGGVQYATMSASGQYATVVTNGTGGPVWYSSNYGQTFTVTTNGTSTNNIRGAGMSASGQYQLAGGYSGGMYYSTNYGQTWLIGSTNATWFSATMSANGQYCLGCIPNGNVWQSTTRSPSIYASNAIISFPSSYYSVGSSGFTTLPGGLIAQWGYYTISTVSNPYTGPFTITFPKTFPSACFSIMATLSDNGPGSNNSQYTPMAYVNNTSGGTIYLKALQNALSVASTGITLFWHAYGN